MSLAYIALGSNLGDRLGQMRYALQCLETQYEIRVLRSSSIYQNRAIGMGTNAEDFFNAVVEVSTTLEPLSLLESCLDIEQQLGRTRSEDGWVPRTIDLDILAYENIKLQDERLTLPHPRIAERDFVAVPLAELSEELVIGGRNLTDIVSGFSRDGMMIRSEDLIQA